ncbi:UrcA family protein [Allosphingosinicella sp.]|uniref:UrcA family protein n=1 Tax=Allosphingosinicella sp. TaxID=2823234 RepID=UPI002FC0B8D7
MTRIRFLIPIAVLATLNANPVLAGQNDWSEPASEIVSYADLDLGTPAGVATLDGRIDRAIRKVCGKAYMDLNTSQAVRQCRKETLASVQSQRASVLAAATDKSIQFSARER